MSPRIVDPSCSDEGASAPLVGAPTGVVGAIWPLMLTVFVCQLPMPASAIFVGVLASDFGIQATTIGGMRGIGGIAALAIGFLAAPLLDRVPRGWTVCVGMAAGAVGTALTLLGSTAGLAASFFVLGCAIALVTPAIQAAGGDLFKGPAAGRAASMVNAMQSLSGVLAGPVLALPALLVGWRGAYAIMALMALLTIAVVARRLSWQPPRDVRRVGYRESFAVVGRAPGAVPLLLTATVRNCVIQAWLAFFAATLADRFDADVGLVAGFWFLGAGCVFVGNVVTARLLGAESERDDLPWWRSADRLLLVSVIAMPVTAPAVYVVSSMLAVLIAAMLFCATVGVGIAALVSILMREYAPIRGLVMGLNATGQNVGLVFGTGLATVGLSLGGYAGLALTLLLISLVSVGLLIVARRSLRAARLMRVTDGATAQA